MPATDTYQEDRICYATSADRRPPAWLTVSDLGTFVVGLEAKAALPEDVDCYQVVDCHLGYQAAEAWLVNNGFGCARDWHYEALGVTQHFLDGEGRPVQRWVRLFTKRVIGERDSKTGQRKIYPRQVWRG